MVDVFEQVEEELRSDRYKRLARTWLPVVGGVLLAALLATLAWWGWQSYQTSRSEKASVAYDRGLEALGASNTAAAEAAFTDAAKLGGGAYRALALNQRAGLAVSANRIPEAIAFLDEAAKVAGDPIIADPSALKAAYLAMDTASLADIEARLEPLTGENRPLRAFAQEALAMARLQHGKPAEAREVLVLLQLGQDVPDSVRQRAQAAIGAIDAGTAAALPRIVAAAAAIPQTVAPAAPTGGAPTVAPPAAAQP